MKHATRAGTLATRAFLVAIAASSVGCSPAAQGVPAPVADLAPAVDLAPGDVVAFEQTFTLAPDYVGDSTRNRLRVVQNVSIEAGPRDAGGGTPATIRVGRVRVWVDRFDGDPAVDTQEYGAETVEQLYTAEESGVEELFAALWLPMVETLGTATLTPAGLVTVAREDSAVAERLEGNRADHLGTALLESALRAPQLLVVPHAGSTATELHLALEVEPYAASVNVPIVVTRDGDTAQLVADLHGSESTGTFDLRSVNLAGAARIAADGLPDEIDWTLEVIAWAPDSADGPSVGQAATLSYSLRRAAPGSAGGE